MSGAIRRLEESVVVLSEQLATCGNAPCHFDEALIGIGEQEAYKPDYIIYIGDTLVSKRAKHFLQHCHPKSCVVVKRFRGIDRRDHERYRCGGLSS